MLNMEDAITENGYLINPFQQAMDKLAPKDASLIKRKLQSAISRGDTQEADRIVKSLKMPKFFQAVGDMSAIDRNIAEGLRGDAAMSAALGIVVPDIWHFSDDVINTTKHINTKINLKVDYFDTTFHEQYLPERWKKIISSSEGWKTDAAGRDMVKTTSRVIEMLKNNSISVKKIGQLKEEILTMISKIFNQ